MNALRIFSAPGRVAALCRDVNFPVVVHKLRKLQPRTVPSATSPDAPIYPSVRGCRMKDPVEGPVVS